MRFLNIVVSLAFLFCVACGGAGSVNGKVAGNALSVVDSAFLLFKENNKITSAAVILSDKPNLCTTAKANRDTKNSTYLIIGLYRYVDDGAGGLSPVSPDVGDYSVVQPTRAGTYAGALFGKSDASCTTTVGATQSAAQSGTVKVTAFKPEANGSAVGTFDITVGTQNDKVTGSFNALFCDVALSNMPNCE
jgi:hypothetical protein